MYNIYKHYMYKTCISPINMSNKCKIFCTYIKHTKHQSNFTINQSIKNQQNLQIIHFGIHRVVIKLHIK